jgi:hypothetical protein
VRAEIALLRAEQAKHVPTADDVLLDLRRLAVAAERDGQYAAAVRALEVAAKVGGLIVERSVNVNLSPGQEHIAALTAKMAERRKNTTGGAGASPPVLHLEASEATVTFTQPRAVATPFDE